MIKRQLQIINFLRIRPYATQEEILNYLKHDWDIEKGLNPRTFLRDLNVIRDTLFLDIRYCSIKRGYFIDEEGRAEFFLEDVLDGFYLLNSLDMEKGLPEYILPEKRRSRGIENFPLIKKAISKKKLVNFRYQKYNEDEPEVRTIEPHALKESRGRWYVLGFDQDDDASKSFGLDRITHLEILDLKYTRRKTDWKKRYAHSFAMYCPDTQPEKVILSFSNEDGNYIESLPIHHSQQIRRENGRTFVELDIRITQDLIMELMSRSWSIEVLQPAHLRKKLYNIYKEATQRNKM